MNYLNISQNVCVGYEDYSNSYKCQSLWPSRMKRSTVLRTVSLGWSHCLTLSSLSSHLIIYTEGGRIYSEFSKSQMNHKSQHGLRILWHQCLCVFSLFCFEIKFTGASCARGITFAPWLQRRENRPGTLAFLEWRTAQQDFMATNRHSYKLFFEAMTMYLWRFSDDVECGQLYFRVE